MAFFKFRKGGDEPQAAPHQPESVEALRARARHRLIGAAVLVLAGVIGFPLLFDTQPRPIAIDIPIDIPDRNKAKPLPAPAAQAPTPAKSESKEAVASAPSASAAIRTEAKPEARSEPASATVAAATRPEPKAEPKTEPKAETKTEARSEAKPPASPRPTADDGNKARALLEGAPPAVQGAAAEGRFIVQVGAFADVTKAKETRQKVERAGLKTYTHVAETKDGKRIRVRVGPFASRAEADKAADRIKGLDLPAAILTL